MSMSKMHYTALAETIKGNAPQFKSNRAHADFVYEMATMLYNDNPRFNARKFFNACMPNHMVGTAKLESTWERAIERWFNEFYYK